MDVIEDQIVVAGATDAGSVAVQHDALFDVAIAIEQLQHAVARGAC